MKPIILCVLILILVGPASGEDYQPLETGNFWSYVAEGGAEEMRVVVEPVPIFNGNPYPLEYTISSSNPGLINFWTSESDGGVLLWGFFRHTWGYLYQPPIRVVDAPLFVGKTWTSTVDLYALPDTTFFRTASFTYEVLENPELTVPAGIFDTFGISMTSNDMNAIFEGSFTPWGESRTSNSRDVDRWYSLDVGVVQDNLDHLYQLETYTDHPVAIEASSWGAVKALYRGGQ
jgi:hypothetical protein